MKKRFIIFKLSERDGVRLTDRVFWGGKDWIREIKEATRFATYEAAETALFLMDGAGTMQYGFFTIETIYVNE